MPFAGEPFAGQPWAGAPFAGAPFAGQTVPTVQEVVSAEGAEEPTDAEQTQPVGEGVEGPPSQPGLPAEEPDGAG